MPRRARQQLGDFGTTAWLLLGEGGSEEQTNTNFLHQNYALPILTNRLKKISTSNM